jgi:hypothetical protein
MRLQGQIVTTLLRGMVVFDGHDVVAPPGTGRFVAPRSQLCYKH